MAVPIDFFGRRLAFAPGFLRLAEKTGAPVAAFVCLRDSQGGYRISFSPVFWPVGGKHRVNAPRLYAFLEACVRRHPGRWWAADMLTYFLTMDAAINEQTHTTRSP
jgi:lauroyl/myristoyl acyltransferase